MAISCVSITILRNNQTTLTKMASVTRAIERQFALFIGANKKPPRQILLEELKFKDTLIMTLFYDASPEQELFPKEDIHSMFVTYCKHITDFITRKIDQTDITSKELDNFNKIVDFAKEGEQGILISYSVKHDDTIEHISEAKIDINCEKGNGNKINRETIKRASDSRKNNAMIELTNHPIVFSWHSIHFSNWRAEIKVDVFYIEQDFEPHPISVILTPEIAKILLRYNDKQKINWQVCRPKVMADIKLIPSIQKEVGVNPIYEIISLEIKEVILHDHKDNEKTLFSENDSL